MWLARILTSAFILENKDLQVSGMRVEEFLQILNFDEEIKNAAEFCHKIVMCWGRDAESPFIELGALERGLECSCNIVMLDRENKGDTIVETTVVGSAESVSIILRPGHYDLLYPKRN